MKPRISFFAIIAVLVLASLACSQAGQILTPEEATAVAGGVNGNGSQGSNGGETVEGQFAVDQVVTFIGTGFLVPIMKEPGDRMAYSNAARGQTATVKGWRDVDGELWYQVTSAAGNGWVAAKNLEASDVQASQPTQAEGSETPTGETGGEASTGFAVGDTVYLVGRAFLLNLYDAPGSRTIRANQQRGEAVVILEVQDVDGVNWYKIDAPTGEGWVPAENISAEKP